MTVLGRLSEFARRPLDAIGAALAVIPDSWSHERRRVAITGLRRSGKTVFVTSFAHALLNAASAPKKALPFFPFVGNVQRVDVEDIPGIPRFPYQEHLNNLLGSPPQWPKPTTEWAGLRIRIRHNPTGFIEKRITSSAILDVDLIDYPGEWLLDLPMLSQTYEEWSAQTEELAKASPRATLSKTWLEEAAKVDLDGPEDAESLARVGRLYVEYLDLCRCEKKLHYLQPGRFLLRKNKTFEVAEPFFPVGKLRIAKSESNAAALVRRYLNYQKSVRIFYSEVFGSLRRQIILVDLLTALQQGHESFADLALAVRTITDAFEELTHPLVKLLPFGRADRLALIATKADHVSADQLLNLVALLKGMIGNPFDPAKSPTPEFLPVASVRATTESMRKLKGTILPFLHGVIEDDTEARYVHAGVIPGLVPTAAAWGQFEFKIRNFEPPLSLSNDQPFPHINLDKVLQSILP